MKKVKAINLILIICCLSLVDLTASDEVDTENQQSSVKISKKVESDTSKQEKKPINTTYTPVIEKDVIVDTGRGSKNSNKLDTNVADPFVRQIAIRCIDKKDKIKALLIDHWKGLNKVGVVVSLEEFAEEAQEITDVLYEAYGHKKLDAEGVMEATASTFIK